MSEKEGTYTFHQLVSEYDNYHSLKEEAEAQKEEGWGEFEKCTYQKGYISQPVYACNTCYEQHGAMFGFCFGCSMDCHVNHDVYELFNKRAFKCDCCTLKGGHNCTLAKLVKEDNKNNVYNHNFLGRYCWCDTKYDINSTAVMIQCYTCQDWFHEKCIQKDYPHPISTDGSDDFICKDCVTKYKSFITKYPHLEYIHNDNETKVKLEPLTTETNQCKIFGLVQREVKNMFMKRGWRESICKCEQCTEVYHLLGVRFLLTEETPEIEEEASEEMEQEKKEQEEYVEATPTEEIQEEKKIERKVPSLQQIEEVLRYQELKEKLINQMKTWSSKKRTITSTDIEDFKESLRKKAKLS